MAATHFNNGDILTPNFINSIYSGGGHVHDGTDSDGHAQKVDLTRDTTNRLPANRIDSSTVTFGMIWPTDYTCVFDATIFANGFVQLAYGTTSGVMDSDTTHISSTVLNPAWGLSPTSERHYPIPAKNNQAMNLSMTGHDGGIHYDLYSALPTEGINPGSIFFSIL